MPYRRLRRFAQLAKHQLITTLDERRYGRPGAILSLAEFKARYPGQWIPTLAADAASRQPPTCFGPQSIDFEAMLDAVPEMGVFILPHGLAMGHEGWAFTDSGEFLSSASWYGSHATATLFPRTFGRAHALTGTCLSLATDFAHGNYCHYLLDSLSRFKLFLEAGFTTDGVDWVYLHKPVSPAAASVLDALNIPVAKRVWVDEAPLISAERLIVTSFPGARRNAPPWVPTFLQSLFPDHQPSGRRLFLPRDGTRKILNEAALFDIAKKYGVELFDYRRDIDVWRLFAEAELVVGAHGAAMTNIAFCRPGAKVLELFSSDHPHPHFYTLACSAAVNYGYLVCPSVATRPPDAFGPSPYDYTVDPGPFENALVQMLGIKAA